MSSYIRGVLNAYRDVLKLINIIDPEHKDENLNNLIQSIDERCDSYLSSGLNDAIKESV